VRGEGGILKFARTRVVNRPKQQEAITDPDPKPRSDDQNLFDIWLSSYRRRLDHVTEEAQAVSGSDRGGDVRSSKAAT